MKDKKMTTKKENIAIYKNKKGDTLKKTSKLSNNGDIFVLTEKGTERSILNKSAIQRTLNNFLKGQIKELKRENNYLKTEIGEIKRILEHHNLKLELEE